MNPFTAMPGTRIRKCITCSQFFEATHPRLTGCSEACRAQARRTKHAERQREARRAGTAGRHKKTTRPNWSNCQTCGLVAQKPADTGCLECYARSIKRKGWSEEERDLLETWAGSKDLPDLQSWLYRKFGNARTREAIRGQMRKMGIAASYHQDGYTIAQLAEITGFHHNSILYYVQNQKMVNVNSSSKVIMISLEDGEKVIERYKRHDRPSYSIDETIRILGINSASLYNGIERGLPSWTEGHRRRVCKASVDRVVGYMKRTGRIRIPWSRLFETVSK